MSILYALYKSAQLLQDPWWGWQCGKPGLRKCDTPQPFKTRDPIQYNQQLDPAYNFNIWDKDPPFPPYMPVSETMSPFGNCEYFKNESLSDQPDALVWSNESGKERFWGRISGGYLYTTPDGNRLDFYMQCPEGQHVHITTAAFAKEKEGDDVDISLLATNRPSADWCAVLEKHDIGSTSRDFHDTHLDGNKKRGDGTSYYQDSRGRTFKPHELMFMIEARCRNTFSTCHVHARVEWECVEDVTNDSIAPAAGHLRAGVLVLVASLLSLVVA